MDPDTWFNWQLGELMRDILMSMYPSADGDMGGAAEYFMNNTNRGGGCGACDE